MDNIIMDLIFAYVNKDIDNPHDYEIEIIKKACNYILYRNTTADNFGLYDREFFENVMKEME
jgi:hypothetical protein